MNRVPKGPSLFSGTLGLFKKKPKRVATHTSSKASAQIVRKKSPYNAAAIAFEECACQSVRDLKRRRFLVRDIPPIPVPDCTSMNCACTYVRYNDRRSWHDDRRAAFSVKSDLHTLGGDMDRRNNRLRRADDEPTLAASELNFDNIRWGR